MNFFSKKHKKKGTDKTEVEMYQKGVRLEDYLNEDFFYLGVRLKVKIFSFRKNFKNLEYIDVAKPI